MGGPGGATPRRDLRRGALPFTRWDALYAAGFVATWPYWAIRALTDGRYRDEWGERFGGGPALDGRPRIWLHTASAGEARAAEPLVAAIRAEWPGAGILWTTTTRTGREVARSSRHATAASYAPVDLSPCVRRVFNRARPHLMILVEAELWPNALRAAADAGVPVVLASARMTERSLTRYRRLGRWLVREWAPVRVVLAQDERMADRYAALGVPRDRVQVAGNLKFDVAPADPLPSPFPSGTPVIVGGSTHAPEERWLLDALRACRRLRADLRLVLAPRYLDRCDEVEALAKSCGFSVDRWTGSSRGGDILLLDKMGILRRAYGWATVAYVGGTLVPRGGHNLLEAAVWGCPMVVGPSLYQVQETAEALRGEGVLRVAGDGGAIETLVALVLADPSMSARAGCERVLARGRGAVQRHMAAIRELRSSYGS